AKTLPTNAILHQQLEALKHCPTHAILHQQLEAPKHRAWSVNSTVAVTPMLGDSGNSPIVRIARSGQTSPERTRSGAFRHHGGDSRLYLSAC
ncbi:hypothetical protein RA280_41650, partial [Cupriavidus sp. CV2]|uniref:hypothetical protein n=1 Tax=Cupriavidus ulmosensis TaxID=3065913 RepID=UPI00296A981A